jgi:hypothetical protein
MSEQELIELLADKEHASWARWMEYLFRICRRERDGSITIPPELVVHWQIQIDTPYSELTEQEKESDRAEVAHILPIIKEYGASLPGTGKWEEAIRLHIQKLNEQST